MAVASLPSPTPTKNLEGAVALHCAVRDGFRHAPYRIDLSHHGMLASTVLEIGVG